MGEVITGEDISRRGGRLYYDRGETLLRSRGDFFMGETISSDTGTCSTIHHPNHYASYWGKIFCEISHWCFKFLIDVLNFFHPCQTDNGTKMSVPVCNHPLISIVCRVASGLFIYPSIICGPFNSTSPRKFGPSSLPVSTSMI